MGTQTTIKLEDLQCHHMLYIVAIPCVFRINGCINSKVSGILGIAKAEGFFYTLEYSYISWKSVICWFYKYTDLTDG